MVMDMRYLGSSGYQLWMEEEVTTSGITASSGTLQLEQGWQLVAVPIQYGYWSTSSQSHVHDGSTIAKFKNYILDQIEDVYGSGQVEVANTYIGDNQFFYSYVVGSTPESSPHNFQLVYEDGEHVEISGFWIKVTAASGIVVRWGGEGGS